MNAKQRDDLEDALVDFVKTNYHPVDGEGVPFIPKNVAEIFVREEGLHSVGSLAYEYRVDMATKLIKRAAKDRMGGFRRYYHVGGFFYQDTLSITAEQADKCSGRTMAIALGAIRYSQEFVDLAAARRGGGVGTPQAQAMQSLLAAVDQFEDALTL